MISQVSAPALQVSLVRTAIVVSQELSDTILSLDVNHATVMPSAPEKTWLFATSERASAPAWRNTRLENVPNVQQASTTTRCVTSVIVFRLV